MISINNLPKKKISDYQELLDPSLYQEIIELASDLKDRSILHVNATGYGGGVADILQSLVPLLNDLGLRARWQVIEGTTEFFTVTKHLHNSLQSGEKFELNKKKQELYEKINFENALKFDSNYDLVVIHDPQPAALPYFLPENETKFLWRLHIDTSSCHQENWHYFAPFLAKYQACVFSAREYSSPTIPIDKKFYIPPAIDPLHPKNQKLSKEAGVAAITSYGIDVSKPIVTQASRFDPWKDPLGVIKAYKIAKRRAKELQLVLVGEMANDDPEGWEIFRELKKAAAGDDDIHLIINTTEKNDITYNSLQRQSDVIVQKSLKEGFGLVVTEAMWKEKAVIGGNTVGIAMQIEDGKTGYLVNNIQECADSIVYLLEHPEISKKIGQAAKESVRKKYLLPRLVRDELRVYRELMSKKT